MLARLRFVFVGLLTGLAFNAAFAFAWIGPTASAPNANVAAPVNVGTAAQIKSGDLTTNSHTVYGDLRLNYGWNPSPSTITYLNFSNAQNPTTPTWGLNGYGIRDNNGTLEFKNSGGSWASLQSIIAGFSGYWTAGTGGAIYYNGGNVGIGTTAPVAKAEIVQNDATSVLLLRNNSTSAPTGGMTVLQMRTGSDTGNANWFNIEADRANSVVRFNTSANMPKYSFANGNVGVGTESPSTILDISSSGSNSIRFRGNTGGSSPYVASYLNLNSNIDYRGRGMLLTSTAGEANAAWFVGVPYTGGIFQIGKSSTHSVETGSGPYLTSNAALSINSTGNVGIGTASPLFRLHVIASNASGAYISNSSGYYSELAYSSYGLYTNGNIYGAAFYYTSDRRLKDNIKPLGLGLPTLMQLNPVSFTWNEEAGLGRAGKTTSASSLKTLRRSSPKPCSPTKPPDINPWIMLGSCQSSSMRSRS
jgi:hypothetical protein